MKLAKFLGIFILLVGLSDTALADEPYGNLRMLKGYKFKRTKIADGISGSIYKEDGGLSIEFESGISQGYAADPKKSESYEWFQEQQIKGTRVFVAITTPGLGTKWIAREPRQAPKRKILTVTFRDVLDRITRQISMPRS